METNEEELSSDDTENPRSVDVNLNYARCVNHNRINCLTCPGVNYDLSMHYDRQIDRIRFEFDGCPHGSFSVISNYREDMYQDIINSYYYGLITVYSQNLADFLEEKDLLSPSKHIIIISNDIRADWIINDRLRIEMNTRLHNLNHLGMSV